MDYTVFVHLADAAGKPLAQDDSRPRGGEYPTTVWQRGDVVADAHDVLVPTAIAPGDYTLLAGMYDPVSGKRLQAAEGLDAIRLATITLP